MTSMARRLNRAALAALALVLAGAAAGQAAAPSGAETLITQARDDLARGDGLAAEVRLKQALDAGAPREVVAARMGEALLDQGQTAKARGWLAPGKFAAAEAAHGWRMLGLLEMREGHLAAAGDAYNKVIALTPKDPQLWVSIGQLRYAGGEHLLALEAADYALELDPDSVRALEFKGLFVRDQFGLTAALPRFEAALAQDPGDLSVMGEYAATLGDLGLASRMLAVTRAMLERDGGNARALLLQAQLAARAGDMSLAKSLLNKTGDRLKGVPARLLLEGVIELEAGNNLLAIEVFEKLAQRQPANAEAQALLARAYYGAGNYRTVVERFAPLAARSDAGPQILTLVARAHEALGRRDLAVPLLERAARSADQPFSAVPENAPIGALLASARLGEAEARSEQLRRANPNSAALQAQAGDVQLALGNGAAALERYRLAARIRMPENLMAKMAGAMVLAGQGGQAGQLAETYLAQNPSSRRAARIVAAQAAAKGDWPRARVLLEYLRANGGERDVRLLSDLSLAQLRAGDAAAAEVSARTAYRLQPANGAAARAWGVSLQALGQQPLDAKALLAKAPKLGA
jgi:predicted Zn-dependent protease